MTIPNLQFPHDRMLDPALEPIIRKLSMDVPSWHYDIPKKTNWTDWSHAISLVGGIHPLDGKRFVRHVSVLDHGRVAGKISVDRKWSRTEGELTEYMITSERIDNGRRGNSMKSIKPEVIIRNAKKFFDAPRDGELLYTSMTDAKYQQTRSIEHLSSNIRHGTAMRNHLAAVQIFMHKLMTNAEPTAGERLNMKMMFDSDSFREDLANYYLADSMSRAHRKYVFIGLLDGDYAYFEDEDSVNTKEAAINAKVVRGSFESLPPLWQDRLAVLQLMSDNELVIDTGFRFNDKSFLVVA